MQDEVTLLSSEYFGFTLQDEDRMVTTEEGLAFAQQCGCLFLESSAKTRENVEKCFEELALKVHPEEHTKHHNLNLFTF